MIESFAARHRLKSRKDVDGTTIIPGRLGHIYEYSSGELGICLLLKTPRAWGFAQRRLVAAGFTIRQSGDSEACATFDPGNDVQARCAISEAKLHPKRLPTAVQLQNLTKGRATRFEPAAVR
jgi:hypothetical protein